MITRVSELYGRFANEQELSENLKSIPELNHLAGIEIKNKSLICNRCGSKLNRLKARLPNNNFYCYECIQMGRIDTLHDLVWIDEPNQFGNNLTPLTWQGKLTKTQASCSDNLLSNLKLGNDHLLWAVTGAGKTEMLFYSIEWALQNKMRIAIVSPRVDVCIELFPRLKAAFENTEMILLHGKSTMAYQYCQVVISTVHQLLRFHQAFDVIIVDEVDVFPYAGNPILHYAVKNALKIHGTQLFLTATPDQELFKLIKQEKIAVSYLPKRFHNHPLPEITFAYYKKLRDKLNKQQLPPFLIKKIADKLEQQIPFLLFVPQIRDLGQMEDVLKIQFPNKNFTTVFANDPDRLSKVKMMRNQKLDFLITTTILERGVTFAGIDIIVFNADNDIFSTAALVQIAGRVGRSKDRPFGEALLICEKRTKIVLDAKKQIEFMNQKAFGK